MQYIYELGIRLPLGKLLDPVKELEESISAHLALDGYEQKLSISYLQKGTIKVERVLSKSEIEIMKKLLHKQFSKSFGSAKIEYFRRQSGNVQQSAS
jgi:hypothetical protein